MAPLPLMWTGRSAAQPAVFAKVVVKLEEESCCVVEKGRGSCVKRKDCLGISRFPLPSWSWRGGCLVSVGFTYRNTHG